MLGLVKGNDQTIGFVYSCLLSGIINMDEVNRWAEKVIGENEVSDLPDYIFDVIDFKGEVRELERLIGFFPNWRCTKAQDRAVYGIAVKRGEKLSQDDVSFNEEQALEALKKHPEVEKLFRETFPFIDF
ncbi:hypothetical protein A9G29_09390 [Gilliamella sp. Fer2-1]|jgi:hypothetical protein|uniref:hypothetical protein n=1 Tax=Gilliamella sp. Choc5-1 TaxID=3120238 RepID=UPI00080E945E|nr:hypothetical protein [Gilliamella apicola]OCG39208.1 hypothetical protein A9G29_09390 [Gilliamella apicola]OCG47553.1 hypothetical protein A9G35_03530 [Gilliamella apicola]